LEVVIDISCAQPTRNNGKSTHNILIKKKIKVTIFLLLPQSIEELAFSCIPMLIYLRKQKRGS